MEKKCKFYFIFYKIINIFSYLKSNFNKYFDLKEFIFFYSINNCILNFTFKEKSNCFENRDKNEIWISIIKNIIQLEKRIEESKISIITRDDFNLSIIMSLFIKENVEKTEFDYFLNKLNISLNNFEKEILLKRVDLTRKGYIKKNELYDFFVPFNNKYREKIELNINKEMNNNNSNLNLSKGTMIYINNLVNIIIKGEKTINSQKKELNADNIFIDNIFKEIINMSKNNDNKILNEDIYENYFIKEQLFIYLKEKLNIIISENELNLLFIRFDKLRRGKIKMLEFSDEMRYIL